MARLILDQFITTGDALSQLVGRWIPVWYDGRWHRYTRSANESISGASDWHRQHGRWPWVAWSIDALFALFGDENHCNKAWANDFNRAVKLLRDNGYEVGF